MRQKLFDVPRLWNLPPGGANNLCRVGRQIRCKQVQDSLLPGFAGRPRLWIGDTAAPSWLAGISSSVRGPAGEVEREDGGFKLPPELVRIPRAWGEPSARTRKQRQQAGTTRQTGGTFP